MKFIQTIIVAAVMLLTAICTAYLTGSNDQPLLKTLSDFPMKIGEWQGIKSRFDDKIYEALGVDDSILANYRHRDQTNIELYIGYYQSQREGDIIHSPKNCMPGAGWRIAAIEPITLNQDYPNGKPVKVNKVILQKGGQYQVMFYWFHSRGRVIASEYAEKIFLVLDSITRHRTDGSFVRLISPVTAEGEHQTAEQLKQFGEQLFPVLSEFIPE